MTVRMRVPVRVCWSVTHRKCDIFWSSCFILLRPLTRASFARPSTRPSSATARPLAAWTPKASPVASPPSLSPTPPSPRVPRGVYPGGCESQSSEADERARPSGSRGRRIPIVAESPRERRARRLDAHPRTIPRRAKVTRGGSERARLRRVSPRAARASSGDARVPPRARLRPAAEMARDADRASVSPSVSASEFEVESEAASPSRDGGSCAAGKSSDARGDPTCVPMSPMILPPMTFSATRALRRRFCLRSRLRIHLRSRLRIHLRGE